VLFPAIVRAVWVLISIPTVARCRSPGWRRWQPAYRSRSAGPTACG